MRPLLVPVLALIILLSGACAPEHDEPQDVGFGQKADELGCDPAAELCWPSADVLAMQRIQASEQGLLLDPDHAYRHQLELFDDLARLDHKLSDTERERVRELSASPLPPEEVLAQLQADVLGGLKGRYLASSMVPVGETLVAELDESADESLSWRADQLPGQFSEGVNASLERLSESGLGGKLYASMLVLSGVLAVDYRSQLDIGAPSGISREEAANQIITRYKRAAGLLGLGSGALSLVPIFGTVLAIPADAFASFALNARMTFEIGGIYGWNINEGNELFTMTMFMFSDGEMEQMSTTLGESVTLPNFIRAMGRQIGLTVSAPLAVRLSSSAIVYLVRGMAYLGEKLAIATTARSAFRGALSTVLGWATAGLAVVGTAVAHYYVADKLGEHVKFLSKHWLVDLPQESAEYLKERGDRDCFFAALASVAQSDGEVSAAEQTLYESFLGKSYYAGQSRWYQLDSAERIAHAQRLASAGQSSACLASAFADEVKFRRLSVISHLFSMLAIDGQDLDEELAAYRAASSGLLAKSSWNDTAIEPYMLNFVETVISRSVDASAIEVPEEFLEARDTLVTEDLLEFLNEIPEEVHADFLCGFAAAC